jgi:hypothetical protein
MITIFLFTGAFIGVIEIKRKHKNACDMKSLKTAGLNIL